MAEIRCPMCGKPNPDDLDVCQFCEARLKPLISSQPSDADPSDGTTPEQPEYSSDLPDWLDFGDNSQLEDDDQAASDDETLFDDSDDWMARLKNDQESSGSSQPGTEPDGEGQSSGRMDLDNNGIPDWLEDLENNRSTPLQDQPEEPIEGDFPTWLTVDQGSDQPGKLSDWMINSRDEVEDAAPQSADEGDLPDWLSDLGGEEPAALEETPSAQPSTPAFTADDSDELPDWLTAPEDSPEESTLPASEGDLPDWLSDLGGEEPAAPEETPSAQPSTPAFTADDSDDLPDWLTAPEDSPEESPLPASEGDLPDWLSDLGGEEPAAPEETPSAQPSTPAFTTDKADEIFRLVSDESDFSEEDESIQPAAEVDLPDWLPDPGGEEPVTPEKVVPTQTSTPAFITEDSEELPDSQTEEENGEVEVLPPDEEGGLPAWFGNTVDEDDELPDWFSDLGGEDDNSETLEIISGFEPIENQDVPPTRVVSVPASISDERDELPDWLVEDDSSDSDDDGLESTTPLVEDELPDWLSDLVGEESISEQESSDDAAVFDELVFDQDGTLDSTSDASITGVTDWLSGGDVDQIKTVLSSPESDLSDWLQFEDQAEAESVATDGESETPAPVSDQEGEEIGAAEAAVATAMLADEAADLPDWLQSDELAEPDSDQPAEESGLPDWLQFEDQAEAESVATDGESETPAPVSDQEGEEIGAAEAAIATAMLAGEAADLPDWLQSDELAEPDSDQPAEESGLPDWLQFEDQAEAESVATDGESETPAPVSDQEGEEIGAAEAAVATAMLADEAADLPDWLQSDELAEPDSDQPAEESGLPDWLQFEDQAEAESVATDGESETPAPVSDQEGEEIGAAEAAIATAVLAGEAADLPDWLRSEETGQADSNLLAEEISGEDSVDEVGQPAISDEDQAPAWISDVDGVEIEPSQESLSEPEPDRLPENYIESRAVPEWLQDGDGEPVSERLDEEPFGDDQETEPVDAVSYETEDIFEDDLGGFDQLPEWLSGSSIADVDQHEGITEPIDGDIATADLPGWLAAMRPVESATSKAFDVDESDLIESSGPLAGLYSVLASQPGITQFKKPPVYSNKLQVTEAQQQHANLLENMIQAESKARALPSAPLITSHRVFRLILGTLLLVIAFFAVFVGDEMVGMPAPEVIPYGVEQSFQIISALSQEDTVLISFDFEPGLIGEMEATSAALLDDIMEKGAKLALVSTSPTGPALAERFIHDAQDNRQDSDGIQYVNLGYIPGGVSGLAAFAQNPNWAAPTSLDGAQAWEMQPLTNIKSISDFALVLLISDNPNTTRAWVEQVNPHLEPAPMVAVVSAQIEPVARTYLGQIDGLISGMVGGAAYEVMGGANLARERWDAFNILLIVAVSAILIGGSISVIPKIIAQQKSNGGESA